MILLGAIPFVKGRGQISEGYSAISQNRDVSTVIQPGKVNYHD